MATAKALLALCVPDEAQQSALLARQQGTLLQWDNWLRPLADGDGVGEAPACDDDFQLMCEEINKLSGTNPETLCHTARNLRVGTWYIFARLQLFEMAGVPLLRVSVDDMNTEPPVWERRKAVEARMAVS